MQEKDLEVAQINTNKDNRDEKADSADCDGSNDYLTARSLNSAGSESSDEKKGGVTGKIHRYVEVIVDLLSNALDRPFHYIVPDKLLGTVRPGMRVRVPFGPRRCQGFVMRLLPGTTVDSLREIGGVVDSGPLLTGEQLALAHWLALRFHCRKIDALHAMIPASFRKGKSPGDIKVVEPTAQAASADLSRAPAQAKAVELLLKKGALPRTELARFGVKSHVAASLEKKGLVRTVLVRPEFRPERDGEKSRVPLSKPHLLQGEQATCFERVRGAVDSLRFEEILLHGITASGKTEIYLQGIAHCLEQGRTAMILVPEIALTPQMIEQFEGRFPGRVAVLHSRLGVSEKNRQWQMILGGRAAVVLGARSAVFAPLDRIGLIVIDEEHETTYKQDEAPRYHARDVARRRARYNRAVLLLGSATPSLESYYRALKGEVTLLRMKERVTPVQLPPVTVVDMRSELKARHRLIFSRLLLTELNGVIERDEQALLFINRRGFAGFVLCRECGHVVRCPSCDVSMTLHIDRQVMCCHYCAGEAPVPLTCPGCRGTKIRYFSAGTQRVEEEVRKLYPGVSLIRMDRDTTTGRQAHAEYYRLFRERKASILVGTQMIAKGFDFPGVTLVGVVAADTTLNLPDFRAPERTFQLLTQVAGRTARGPGGGKVIVQTYHPGHHSIVAAADHDYLSFYEKEIENRRQLSYPPFSDLVRFLFSGPDEDEVFGAASRFTELLAGGGLGNQAVVDILGPAPAALFRIKEQFRVQTVLKGENLARLAPKIKKVVNVYREAEKTGNVRLAVDFNPLVVL